jgi:carotenoid cleavage dioxygenase-like enzyme
VNTNLVEKLSMLIISVVGASSFHDLDGTLEDAMSAHPRVDRDREELHNLSYDVMKGTCTYYRYDQHR